MVRQSTGERAEAAMRAARWPVQEISSRGRDGVRGELCGLSAAFETLDRGGWSAQERCRLSSHARPKKQPNGRWKARVGEWDPVSQKIVRQITRTFDRKWEADAWIDQQRGGAPSMSERANLRLRDYVDVFADEIFYGLRSTQTEANYRGHIKLRIIPALGHVKIQSLRASDVERAQMKWGELASHTVVMGTRNCLSRICRLAVKQELLESNPVVKASRPPVVLEQKRPTLSQQEASYLIAALRKKNVLFGDLAEVALGTGVRAGELLALRPSDCNFDDESIHVQRAWSGTGSNRCLSPTKSTKDRFVPMPQSLIPVLRRRIELVGVRADMLWVGPRGGSLRHSNVLSRSGFKGIVRDMGHPDFRWHDLRATAIATWIRSGISLAQVRDWAGHSSLTVTDRYARSARTDHEASMKKLNGIR